MDVLKIGLLGGIGPEATAAFYKKLIEKFQQKKIVNNNKDYPHIIINSIPAPELIYNSIDDMELIPYIDGLKELDKFNVDFVVMICNTIHLFYDKLQKSIKTPIIDIRNELETELIKGKIKTVTVLGTPNTVKKRLYKFDNIKIIDPNEEELKKLTTAILCFNRGIEKEKQSKICENIAKKYIKKGAQLIILGCTELALILKDSAIPRIDPFDVMIGSIIKRYKKQKFK